MTDHCETTRATGARITLGIYQDELSPTYVYLRARLITSHADAHMGASAGAGMQADFYTGGFPSRVERDAELLTMANEFVGSVFDAVSALPPDMRVGFYADVQARLVAAMQAIEAEHVEAATEAGR